MDIWMSRPGESYWPDVRVRRTTVAFHLQSSLWITAPFDCVTAFEDCQETDIGCSVFRQDRISYLRDPGFP